MTIDAAEKWVEWIASHGFDEFCTGTRRAPCRVRRMAGGSVYFVRAGHTLFRMPFKRMGYDEKLGYRWGGGEHLIIMESRLIRVEQRAVGFVRGWRYLEDKDAPPDLAQAAGAGDASPEMARKLQEMGLA